MKGLVTLFLALVLMSCSAVKKSQSLDKTSWQMKSLEVSDQKKEISSDIPRLQFAENEVLNGTTGCNSFFGRYNVSKEGKLTLLVEGITKAFCEESQDVEDVFLNQKMMQELKFSICKDVLVLENEGQKLRIEFVRE